eukprot:1161975-Pelagomonas_calceolata.AAC.5
MSFSLTHKNSCFLNLWAEVGGREAAGTGTLSHTFTFFLPALTQANTCSCEDEELQALALSLIPLDELADSAKRTKQLNQQEGSNAAGKPWCVHAGNECCIHLGCKQASQHNAAKKATYRHAAKALCKL